MSNYELISKIAAKMGKTRQDISNWTFAKKVPKAHRFDIYLLAKMERVELTKKDFDVFEK